jgi:hypothetical protein
MAATATPYGLIPYELAGGALRAAARKFRIGANNTNAIYFGSAVSLNSGVITVIGATPTTTRNGNTPVGIFVGCEYVDATGRPTWSQYLVANATSSAGYTNIYVYVVDDPRVVFKVQADEAVATTALGLNAPLVNVTSGSATSGNSTCALDGSAVASTNTLAVKIIGFVESVYSTPGDAYTDCLVVWNQGVHAYQNATGA